MAHCIIGVTMAATGLLLSIVLSTATASTSILSALVLRVALIEPTVILSVASPANLASSPLLSPPHPPRKSGGFPDFYGTANGEESEVKAERENRKEILRNR